MTPQEEPRHRAEDGRDSPFISNDSAPEKPVPQTVPIEIPEPHDSSKRDQAAEFPLFSAITFSTTKPGSELEHGLDKDVVPKGPTHVPGVAGEIEPASKTVTEILQTLLRHIRHPSGLVIHLKVLTNHLLPDKSCPKKLLEIEDVRQVGHYIARQMSRKYVVALTAGFIAAASLSKAHNPLLSMFMANIIDWAACTATLAAGWMGKFRNFYFDPEAKEISGARRKFLWEMFKADTVVSSVIYGISFIASSSILLASQSIKPLASLASHTGAITALISYSLFLMVAAKNISNCVREMNPSFKQYWLFKRKEKEGKTV